MLLVVGLGSYYLLRKGQELQGTPQVPPELAERHPADPQDQFPVVDIDPQLLSEPLPSPRDTGPAVRPRPDAKIVEKPAKPLQPTLPPSIRDALTMPKANIPSIESVPLRVALDLVPRELNREDQQHRLLDQLHKGRTQRLEFECRQTALGMKTLKQALEAQGIGLLIDKRAYSELKAYELGLPSKMEYAIYTENVTAEEVLKIVQTI
jgi:hypothetical protein